MEVCYLLLYGELPNKTEKQQFVETIRYHTMVHDQLSNLFKGFRRDAHPMAIMCGVVGALSSFYDLYSQEFPANLDPPSRAP